MCDVVEFEEMFRTNIKNKNSEQRKIIIEQLVDDEEARRVALVWSRHQPGYAWYRHLSERAYLGRSRSPPWPPVDYRCP